METHSEERLQHNTTQHFSRGVYVFSISLFIRMNDRVFICRKLKGDKLVEMMKKQCGKSDLIFLSHYCEVTLYQLAHVRLDNVF